MDKNCYGFDFDGVIVKIPPVFNFFGKKLEDSVLKLNRFKAFRIIYNSSLRVNFDVKERINFLKKMGNKVVIISARGEYQRKEMENFLGIKRIGFNQLILRNDLEEPITNYKLKNILKVNCKYYWEDRERIVDYINSQVGRNLAILYPKKN